MQIIDCEHQESAINSLCGLFRCSPDDLCFQLQQIDLGEIYAEAWPDHSPDEFLYRHLLSVFGSPDQPQSIYWFHLSRTFSGNDFHEGILPLGMALDSIWDMILRTLKATQHYSRLLSMRTQGLGNYHYRCKVSNRSNWGPYAMLVREVAFHAEQIVNHDYLKMPEIIEDICNYYLDEYGISIISDIEDALVPCIIKFRTDANNDRGIRATIYYVYNCMKGKPVSQNANTCFDAGAKVIPFSDINCRQISLFLSLLSCLTREKLRPKRISLNLGFRRRHYLRY